MEGPEKLAQAAADIAVRAISAAAWTGHLEFNALKYIYYFSIR